MDVQPIFVPINRFGIEDELAAVLLEALEERVGVVGAKDVVVVDDEGTERVELLLALFRERLEALHRVFRVLEERRKRSHLPRRDLAERFRQLLRRFVEKRHRVFFKALRLDCLRFHPRSDVIQEPTTRGPLFEVLTLEKAQQINETAETRRVGVARGHLVDECGLFHHRLRRYGQDSRSDHVDRDDVENDVGVHRKQILPAHGHPHERRGGREAFVPPRERKLERALHDRGSHDGAGHALFGGNELLAEALCVGVDVRPTPVLRFGDTELGEA